MKSKKFIFLSLFVSAVSLGSLSRPEVCFVSAGNTVSGVPASLIMTVKNKKHHTQDVVLTKQFSVPNCYPYTVPEKDPVFSIHYGHNKAICNSRLSRLPEGNAPYIVSINKQGIASCVRTEGHIYFYYDASEQGPCASISPEYNAPTPYLSSSSQSYFPMGPDLCEFTSGPAEYDYLVGGMKSYSLSIGYGMEIVHYISCPAIPVFGESVSYSLISSARGDLTCAYSNIPN